MQSLSAISLSLFLSASEEVTLAHRAINSTGKCKSIARKRLVSKASGEMSTRPRRKRAAAAAAAGGVVLHEIKNVLSSFA